MIANSKVFSRCFLFLIITILFLKKSFDPKIFFRSLAVPFEKVTSQIVQSSQELLSKTESKETLIKLCKELSNENASLKIQLQQNYDLQNRLTTLESLTKIDQQVPYKKIFSRIIRRDISAWFESATLNKGKIHGIKENAIVIASCGIIGKVTEVFEKFSIMIFTSSSKFRLAVCLENFRIPMIFTGNGHKYIQNLSGKYELKALGILKNIPINAEPFLEKGSRIICSALTSGTLDGLSVGYVENIHPSLDGMFLAADILLPENLTDFNEVIILVPNDL